MGNITEYDMYLFGTGVHYDIYKKLGAHPDREGRKKRREIRGMGAPMRRKYG